MKYYGKTAYQGDIVKNYERDRIVETIWFKEQNWVSDYLANIPNDSTLLDIPVGTGRFLPIYAQKQINVLGFDISDDMITQSDILLTSLPDNKASIELKVSDAEHMDIADNAVDYTICFRLFHLIPFEIVTQIIAEFYRVTKKQVVIQVFNSSLNFAPPPKKGLTLKRVLSAVKRRLIVDKQKPEVQNTVEIKAWSHITNFTYDYHQLYNQFTLAGFTKINVESITDQDNPTTIFLLSK